MKKYFKKEKTFLNYSTILLIIGNFKMYNCIKNKILKEMKIQNEQEKKMIRIEMRVK